MTREILFRGKRQDNGEWVCGYPVIDVADCSLKKVGLCKVPHDGSFACMAFWDDDDHEFIGAEVSPSTIGQYTGLKDKTGRKIFEGDILMDHTDPEHPEAETHAVIEWRGFGWVLVQYSNGKGYADRVVQEDDGTWTIIGNIWDNPELIEDKQ